MRELSFSQRESALSVALVSGGLTHINRPMHGIVPSTIPCTPLMPALAGFFLFCVWRNDPFTVDNSNSRIRHIKHGVNAIF
jgi:hypothetical protein